MHVAAAAFDDKLAGRKDVAGPAQLHQAPGSAQPLDRNLLAHVVSGRQMSAHAQELEASYFQLQKFALEDCKLPFNVRHGSSEDPETVDENALGAANRLAKQRIDMYNEDDATAVNLTRKKAKKDDKAPAGGDQTPGRRRRTRVET